MFLFPKIISIDINSNRILIIYDGRIVTDSAICLVEKEKHIFFGEDFGINKHKTLYPIRYGKIIDLKNMVRFLNHTIMLIPAIKKMFLPNLNAIVSIPSNLSIEEKKDYSELFDKSIIKKHQFVPQILSGAIGIGVDIFKNKANCLIYIGHSLTNVGIIKKGVVVENDTLQIGTDLFNADIYKYLIKNRNIICSRNDIEKIRLEVGAVTEINHDKPPEDIYIQGIHVDTLKLIQEQISYLELIEPLKHTVIKIAELAKKVSLYSTNNDSIVDIGRSGIYLIGVGSMLRGLDHLISIETDLAVYIGEEPIRTIVRGLGIIANDIDKTHPDTSKYVDYSIINKF